jgi:methylated-DNA-[protein]-cysteine S-methyltransferase
MDLFVDRMPTPIGNLFLVWQGASLRALDFGDYEDRFYRLLKVHYGDCSLTPAAAPAGIRGALASYFDGQITAIERIPVETNGTPFQLKVWAALRHIPAGGTISYGELAARIGNPTASRAVGLANGSNPIGIVVPCHRVIGANGKLTGYGGGLDRKRWLLEHERGALFVAERQDRIHVQSAPGGQQRG